MVAVMPREGLKQPAVSMRPSDWAAAAVHALSGNGMQLNTLLLAVTMRRGVCGSGGAAAADAADTPRTCGLDCSNLQAAPCVQAKPLTMEAC